MKKKRRPRDEATVGVSTRKTALLTVAALGFIAVLALWSRPAPKTLAARATNEPALPEVRPPEAPATLPPPAAPTASTIAGGPVEKDPPPIVDQVILEKTEVCAGEENLVTVKAHTPNGTDPYLHYMIDGQLGQAVPVRMFQNGKDDRVAGNHQITVFGRGNTSVTVPIPNYRVKDCQPARIVNIETRVRANSWAYFDLQAKIVLMPPLHADRYLVAPKDFVPVSYVWKFGDGETATTTAPIVSHDYEGRPQDALYSYFVVGVEARGKDGEVVAGRTSLALLNPAFEALAVKGVVALMISLDPRFPELGSDGRVTQKVRVWHHRPGPVTILRAWRTKYFEAAAGESKPEVVDVASVLGTATIPAGRDGITTTAVLDTNTEPDVHVITYRFEGTSQEGYPVGGSFSVMVPPPKPTAENSQKIVDRTMKAKIMAARAILGKDVVTDEDLWMLERQGKFANLVVPPEPTNGPPPPPPTPPGPNMGAAAAAVHGPAAPKSTNEQAAQPEAPSADTGKGKK